MNPGSSAARMCDLETLLDGMASPIPQLAVTGLAMDSRRVESGHAFLAVKGTRGHGLAHLPQALARGASAIVWEPAPDQARPQAAVPCVEVDGLSVHVGEIAARFYGRPADRMFVAGITGTDGKTSAAHLIAQAFERLGKPCAYIGTLGSGRLDDLAAATHTTPDPIALHAHLADFIDAGTSHCAMEVSSHALDQNRIGGVSFDAAVLTNITRDHLDYHGTIEHYASAKRRLFESDDERALILNRDDEHGARWIEQLASERMCVYGIDGKNPAQARYLLACNVQLDDTGLGFDLQTHLGNAPLRTALLGRFNAYNLLAAAAVLLESGVTLDAAADALSHSRTVPGRIEGFRGPRTQALVVVDYAHTPKALEQILHALRAHTSGKLVCVFGCGGERDHGKRPLMGEAAARLADRAIVTDDNPRSEAPKQITDEILAGIPAALRHKVQIEHERAAAIESAIHGAQHGDVILLAGKGHETTQDYGREVRHFSDRAYVAERVGANS
ncbi:MAG: UDP-N-acetylmuramoyl-L-alanyl-D-glutamate--2,6-diaminopimelate ligase [Panacagrimonas sp.]